MPLTLGATKGRATEAATAQQSLSLRLSTAPWDIENTGRPKVDHFVLTESYSNVVRVFKKHEVVHSE